MIQAGVEILPPAPQTIEVNLVARSNLIMQVGEIALDEPGGRQVLVPKTYCLISGIDDITSSKE